MAIAARDVDSPLYRARIEETVAWTLREMVAESGAFAATYDADPRARRGSFTSGTKPRSTTCWLRSMSSGQRAFQVDL